MITDQTIERLNTAGELLDRHEYAYAFQIYDEVLSADPFTVAALLGRAVCHIHFNRFVEGRNDLELLLLLHPHHIDALKAVCAVSAALGVEVSPEPLRKPLSLGTCPNLAVASAFRLDGTEKTRAFSLFELSNPYLIGGHRLIVTSAGQIILEQQHGTFDDAFHSHQSSYWAAHLPRVTAEAEWLPGCYYSLIGPWSCCNFYHWTADALPQVLLAEEAGFEGTYIIPTGMAFVDESLDLLGIPKARRLKLATNGVQVERLWVSDCMAVEQLPKAPFLAHQLRERILSHLGNANPISSKRLLVSRGGLEHKGSRQRLIVNEVELLNTLAPYGFERVEFDLLTLREQVLLASSADAIIGAHGSGLTHTIFMPPKSLFIELFSPRYIHPGCFMPITKVMGHRYFSFLPYISTDGKYEHGHDVHANIPLIEMTVARELGC